MGHADCQTTSPQPVSWLMVPGRDRGVALRVLIVIFLLRLTDACTVVVLLVNETGARTSHGSWARRRLRGSFTRSAPINPLALIEF
jgi:hypothetical protein